MLEFSDAPYCFFAPQPSSALIRLGRALNRWFILPGPNHLIREVLVSGEIDALRKAHRNGDRLLFVMNHPSHSDPQVVAEIHRRLGIQSCFMAAYDVFLRGKFTAWGMRRMGNFSVDREGADRKAMATAIQVLRDGTLSLNIFPEGNVYLTNDRIAPFMDGAAFIAIKAQAAVDDAPVKVIPLSLKLTHLTTPSRAITQRMIKLGADSHYQFPPGASDDPVGAVLGLGRHILGHYLEAHGFHGEFPNAVCSLAPVLHNFASNLVDRVENGLGFVDSNNADLVSRIAKVRAKIHQIRTDAEATPHPEIDGLADRAILALRIHGYLMPYLTENPTIDRYDETVERIAEDFYSRNMPRTGPRRALAQFGEPIDVRSFLGAKSREAIAHLTNKMEIQIQKGIEILNTANEAPGGHPV